MLLLRQKVLLLRREPVGIDGCFSLVPGREAGLELLSGADIQVYLTTNCDDEQTGTSAPAY